MNPTLGSNTRQFLASAWHTLQMTSIALTPWSLLALALGPAYYRCWWLSRLFALLPWQWHLPEEIAWCEPQQMSNFEFYLMLSGIVWLPLLSLSMRKLVVKRLLRGLGAMLGLWAYLSVGPTFFFWVVGKT